MGRGTLKSAFFSFLRLLLDFGMTLVLLLGGGVGVSECPLYGLCVWVRLLFFLRVNLGECQKGVMLRFVV